MSPASAEHESKIDAKDLRITGRIIQLVLGDEEKQGDGERIVNRRRGNSARELTKAEKKLLDFEFTQKARGEKQRMFNTRDVNPQVFTSNKQRNIMERKNRQYPSRYYSKGGKIAES